MRDLFPPKALKTNLHFKIDAPPDLPPWHKNVVYAMALNKMAFDPTPLPADMTTKMSKNDLMWHTSKGILKALTTGGKEKGVGKTVYQALTHQQEWDVVKKLHDSWDHYVRMDSVSIPTKSFTQALVFPQGDAFRAATTNEPDAVLSGLRLYPKFGGMYADWSQSADEKSIEHMRWNADTRQWELMGGADGGNVLKPPLFADEDGMPLYRSSNFALPPTRIKTLFFISKQATSELDTSAWFDEPQSYLVATNVHKDSLLDFITELGQDTDTIHGKSNRVVPNDEKYSKHYGLAHSSAQKHWVQPYGKDMYAMRMGLKRVD